MSDQNGAPAADRQNTARLMRNALTIIHLRLQLMHRRRERGGLDAQPLPREFAAIDRAVRELTLLVDRIG
jgi:hypothetical protein